MAQKEFKVGNFAKLFNYNVFFGDYLQYISWAVKNSKTVDTLVIFPSVSQQSTLHCIMKSPMAIILVPEMTKKLNFSKFVEF